MQPTSPEFKAHAAGTTRQPRSAVRVTWPAGVNLPTDVTTAVESVRVSRDLTGGLPVETSLVEGSTSSETEIVLSGEFSDGRRPLREMHPYRNGAAMQNKRLEGQPIQTDGGFELPTGVEMIPAHRGKIRSAKIDQGAGTVTLTALDDAERLRAAVSLPSWGVFTNPFGESGPATNLQWVVDFALRRNGVYSSLPIRNQDTSTAAFAVSPWSYVMGYTGHGSVCPDVGVSTLPMFGTLADPTSVYVPGKWGLAASGPTRELTNILGVADGVSATLFEGYVKCGAGDTGTTTVNIGAVLSVQLAAGVAKVIHNPGGTVSAFTLTGASSWRYVQLLAYSDINTTATGVKWSLRVGTQTASGTWTGQTQVSQGLEVIAPGDLPWQALQCYGSPAEAWIDSTTAVPIDPTASDRSTWDAPDAVLDTSTQWVLNLPGVTARETWTLLREIAASELAYIGFDEGGVFRYRTRDGLAANLTETITSDKVSSVAVSMWLDAIRDTVQATYTPQIVKTDQTGPAPGVPSPSASLGTRSDVVRVLPGVATTYTTLSSTTHWWPQATTIFPWTAGGQAWDTTGFAASQDANGTTAVPAADLSKIKAFVEPVDATTWRLRWSNTLGYTAYIVYPSAWSGLSDITVGNAALRIFGSHIAEAKEAAEVPPTVITKKTDRPVLADRRVLDLGDSPWRGYRPALESLLSAVLSDTKRSLPRLDDIDLPANPARQIGDVVELVDSTGDIAPMVARIVKIDRVWRPGVGARDTLSLRAVAPPGAWILGRSRLGIDTRLV